MSVFPSYKSSFPKDLEIIQNAVMANDALTANLKGPVGFNLVLTFSCLKLTTEMLEKGVKYVQG